MARLTLEQLRGIRAKGRESLSAGGCAERAEIVLGTGTCGIAAGANESFDAFVEEIARCGVENVSIRRTGCMGLCYAEPTVRVNVPGMPQVVYGNVGPSVAREIVAEHLVKGRLVEDHIFDTPAEDIIA